MTLTFWNNFVNLNFNFLIARNEEKFPLGIANGVFDIIYSKVQLVNVLVIDAIILMLNIGFDNEQNMCHQKQENFSKARVLM